MSRGFQKGRSGFRAGEQSLMDKPRKFLTKIEGAIKDAFKRIEELKGTGRFFDLEIALNELDRALIARDFYESKRAAFGAREGGNEINQLANRVGVDAKELSTSGFTTSINDDILKKMEGVLGNSERANAYRGALKYKLWGNADDVAKAFPSNTAEFKALEAKGELAKGASLKEIYGRLSIITEDLVNVASSRESFDKKQRMDELLGTFYAELRSYDVPPRIAAQMSIMASASAKVKIDSVDESGKKDYNRKGGYDA